MANARLTVSKHHVQRPRLLEKLADAPGFVVWLEAPYGYGKSFLAAQWAEELERDGHHVKWVSLAGRNAKEPLAEELGLPPSAPWRVIEDTLWEDPTLLVLEDLTGEEELGPLLAQERGLVLIASRSSLPYPELLKLRTSGRLQHVTSSELAFSEEEALTLFGGEEERAHAAWQQTRGWPLPLHFASLTGELPRKASLVGGVKQSVSPQAWRELLFHASVGDMPASAANSTTGELVRSGFVQPLAGGTRLHPLIADSLLSAHGEEVRAEVREQAARLEPKERGAAFLRLGMSEELLGLLVSGEGRVFRNQPTLYLEWNRAVPPSEEVERRAYVAIARLLLEQFDEASASALEVIRDESVDGALRAHVLGFALYTLARARRFEEVSEFAELVDWLLPHLPPEAAVEVLHDMGTVACRQGDYAAGEERYLAGLEQWREVEPGPARNQGELALQVNLSTASWELRGNIEDHIRVLADAVARSDLTGNSFTITNQNLAMMLARIGEDAAAMAALERAIEGANPVNAIPMRALAASLTGDFAPFPGLLAEARRWEALDLTDRVGAIWLGALRIAGDLDTAFELKEQLAMGPYTKLEFVWAHVARGELGEAQKLLAETKDGHNSRDLTIEWHLAAYMVDKTEERLDEALSLTSVGAKILRPAGLPVQALPPGRPELALHYPLKEALTYGSPAVVELRLPEVPPMELRLLGGVSATVLGEELQFSGRQRELLALLALGLDREQIAEEMWPEVDSQKQRNSLGVQFNLLRKVLEPWGAPTFVVDGQLTRYTSDVCELQAALEGDDVSVVLDLYVGPFAPGVEVSAVEEERHALRERVLQALARLAGVQELITGEEVEVAPESAEQRVRALRRLLELDTINEEAAQALIILLLKLGRRRQAERQYERFKEALLSELGVEPDPSTTALLNA